jgi:Rrf2 family transcriptional regulator, cysteine metabolism repressor
MNFSTKCEYAIRAVLDLTLQASDQPVRIADIASRQQIPQKFLETILAELKRESILASRRGAEGGYLLARQPELITLGQVVRTIESGRSTRGSSADRGPLHELWREVDSAIASVLDRKSFAELAREVRERQTSYVPNWEI